jgi:excisionase family DNA binding protein
MSQRSCGLGRDEHHALTGSGSVDRRTYTVEEAGTLLGVCRNTAYALAKSGELPTIRLGRRLLVPKAALDALLSGRSAG